MSIKPWNWGEPPSSPEPVGAEPEAERLREKLAKIAAEGIYTEGAVIQPKWIRPVERLTCISLGVFPYGSFPTTAP